METEKMIRELKRVEEIHKHDKVFIGDLNIAEMARDARERLEELKNAKKIFDKEQVVKDTIQALGIG